MPHALFPISIDDRTLSTLMRVIFKRKEFDNCSLSQNLIFSENLTSCTKLWKDARERKLCEITKYYLIL